MRKSNHHQFNWLTIQFLLLGIVLSPGIGWGDEKAELPRVENSSKLSVATCQFPVSDDISQNATWIRNQMREAAEQNADIVHFSEIALSGYAGVDRPDMSDYDWSLHGDEFK